MLIVNADDFGASERVNAAISEAFSRGLITSTTLLANGAAFDDAHRLAHINGFAHCVGVHLNLTEGKPLTHPIKKFKRFCDGNGNFCFTRSSQPFFSLPELEAIYVEFCGQIDKCQTAFPKLIHADSHHHVHTEFLIGLAAARAVRSHGLTSLRLSDNVRPASLLRQAYKKFYNGVLGLAGLRRCDYFCDLAQMHRLTKECASAGQLVEVMVHPIYSDDNKLVDAGFGDHLSDVTGLMQRPISFAHYHKI